jgi:hypothetical protein
MSRGFLPPGRPLGRGETPTMQARPGCFATRIFSDLHHLNFQEPSIDPEILASSDRNQDPNQDLNHNLYEIRPELFTCIGNNTSQAFKTALETKYGVLTEYRKTRKQDTLRLMASPDAPVGIIDAYDVGVLGSSSLDPGRPCRA